MRMTGVGNGNEIATEMRGLRIIKNSFMQTSVLKTGLKRGYTVPDSATLLYCLSLTSSLKLLGFPPATISVIATLSMNT